MINDFLAHTAALNLQRQNLTDARLDAVTQQLQVAAPGLADADWAALIRTWWAESAAVAALRLYDEGLVDVPCGDMFQALVAQAPLEPAHGDLLLHIARLSAPNLGATPNLGALCPAPLELRDLRRSGRLPTASSWSRGGLYRSCGRIAACIGRGDDNGARETMARHASRLEFRAPITAAELSDDMLERATSDRHAAVAQLQACTQHLDASSLSFYSAGRAALTRQWWTAIVVVATYECDDASELRIDAAHARLAQAPTTAAHQSFMFELARAAEPEATREQLTGDDLRRWGRLPTGSTWSLARALAQCAAIAGCIANYDADAAQRTMRRHLRRLRFHP